MAKFKFRLQNILDIKLKLETQEKTNFSMAIAALHNEEEKLQKLHLQKEAYEDEYRRVSSGKLNVRELKFAKDNIEYIKGRIIEQNDAVNYAKRNVEIARFRMNEAIKERKIYEKLREKAFEDFLHEENEGEKKEIDQLVSFRYNDKGKAGAE